jgi:hypothetical protein
VIELPPLASPVDQLWHAILDLSERLTIPWTLVGGQMVLLHALEHGQVPPEPSQDADVVADLRADHGALIQAVRQLYTLGFALDTISTDGLAHRYSRPAEPRPVLIDILAPDGLGARTDLTTSPPGRTVQAPGGTQALSRTEHVTIVHEGRRGQVPRPTLLGAIIMKAAATGLPSPARHYRDLALLCSLVEDPFSLTAQLTSKDRQRLLNASALADDANPVWSLIPPAIRGAGQITYQVLTAPS